MSKVIKINSLILITGLIYIAQNLTIGQISFFEETYIFKPILLKEILFIISSLILSITLFKWEFLKGKH